MILTKMLKPIPARRKTMKLNWCKKDWMTMTQQYRKIRSKMRPMDTCKWCGHKFEDGEKFALANPTKGVNVVLCSACADAIISA